MDEIVFNEEAKLMNGNDIIKITDGKVKLMLYEDLKNVSNLDNILSPYNATILAYESADRQGGHWVLLMKQKYDNYETLEFFDSYGLKPDAEEKFDIYNKVPYLTALLKSYKGHVEYNKYPFQQFSQTVNTCGRHVGSRVSFRHLTLDQYIKMFEDNPYNCTPDQLVTLITLLI
jgi:hypothetical protein